MKSIDIELFRIRLKDRLKDFHYTHKDLSEKTGINVNTIDKWSKKSVTVGFDSMIGRSTVYRKVLTHPTNHRVAVVVRCWSFGKLDAEKNVLEGKKKSSNNTPAIKQEKHGVRRGKVYDF